jgi:hypothetical protein
MPAYRLLPGESWPPRQPINSSTLHPLNGLVYKGVWAMHSRPIYKRWIWTLEDGHALLALTSLAMLLAVTQTRAWILIRRFVFERTKAVQLPGSAYVDPNSSITQVQAARNVLSLVRLRRLPSNTTASVNRRSSDESWHASVVSPWYGISALLNFVFFVAIGTLVPYVLTDGSLEAPIVRSTITQDCLTRRFHIADAVNQPLKAEAIFQQCFNAVGQGCDAQFHLVKPQISKKRLDSCPFGLSICANGTRPLEITHWNIKPYELGINSRSTLSMTHRLICTPVNLAAFTVLPKGRNYTFVSAQSRNTAFAEGFQQSLTLQLDTWNGPHQYSNTSSGLWRAARGAQTDLTLLPRLIRPMGSDPWDNSTLMNRALLREDGRSFLAVFRAGALRRGRQSDDPFFSAHQPLESTVVADYEATGLGFLEQFQYCANIESRKYCTSWMAQNRFPLEMARRLNSTKDIDSLTDLLIAYRAGKGEGISGLSAPGFPGHNHGYVFTTNGSPPTIHSVFTYIGVLAEVFRIPPLRYAFNRQEIKMGNSTEEWMEEVELWFMKTILQSILTTQTGALYALMDRKSLPPWFSGHHSLCDRILFRDADYTNINWIGLWAVISSLALICLISLPGRGMKRLKGWLVGNSSKLWKVVLALLELSPISLSQRDLSRTLTSRMWNGVNIRDSTEDGVSLDRLQPGGSLSNDQQINRIALYEDIDGVL